MMSVTAEVTTLQPKYPPPPTAADLAVSDINNDSLVLRLQSTPNHLSRWLTPITDPMPLERSPRRGEPSVMELLQKMRDEELLRYPQLHMIANQINPDLDAQEDLRLDPARQVPGFDRSPLSVQAEFRRLRQSTCGLLRALPNSAWTRVGTSRIEHDWQIRTLAEYLVDHDMDCMYAMDMALYRSGARRSINQVSQVHYQELLKLTPVRAK